MLGKIANFFKKVAQPRQRKKAQSPTMPEFQFKGKLEFPVSCEIKQEEFEQITGIQTTKYKARSTINRIQSDLLKAYTKQLGSMSEKIASRENQLENPGIEAGQRRQLQSDYNAELAALQEIQSAIAQLEFLSEKAAITPITIDVEADNIPKNITEPHISYEVNDTEAYAVVSYDKHRIIMNAEKAKDICNILQRLDTIEPAYGFLEKIHFSEAADILGIHHGEFGKTKQEVINTLNDKGIAYRDIRQSNNPAPTN